jgi:hypothetical protein
VHYKLYENKNLKARGPQIITQTLTILKIWICVWVTILIGVHWVHSVQNEKKGGLWGAQCTECASVGWNTHALSDTRLGGIF